MHANRRYRFASGQEALAADQPGWRDAAACRQVDPDVFFLDVRLDSAAAQLQVAAAKSVCAGCLVRAECLAWALAAQERFGVWGGLSEVERLALTAQEQTVGEPAAASGGEAA